MSTKRRALATADKLTKAAAHNLQKARLRLESLPSLLHAVVTQLESCLEGTLGPGADVESLGTRKRVRDAIHILYVFISQMEFAAQAVSDMGGGGGSDLAGTVGRRSRHRNTRGFQQSECAFPRIDNEIAIAQSRGGASDSELLAECFPI